MELPLRHSSLAEIGLNFIQNEPCHFIVAEALRDLQKTLDGASELMIEPVYFKLVAKVNQHDFENYLHPHHHLPVPVSQNFR